MQILRLTWNILPLTANHPHEKQDDDHDNDEREQAASVHATVHVPNKSAAM